jgi:hypothetical protein
MASRRRKLGCLVACLGLLAATRGPAQGQFGRTPDSSGRGAAGMPPFSLAELPASVQEGARAVLEKPTLAARGPGERFACRPATYRWLLEHPDCAVRLWRQIGARVSEIEDQGGVFRWCDGSGSEVAWQAVLRRPGVHLWYAEGKVKPGLLLPAAPVKALAMMCYAEGTDAEGKPGMRHQVHFLLRTDSRSLALAARLLGGTAPRLAEQYLGQLQLFYGGLAWHLDQDTERARGMFRKAGVPYPWPANP